MKKSSVGALLALAAGGAVLYLATRPKVSAQSSAGPQVPVGEWNPASPTLAPPTSTRIVSGTIPGSTKTVMLYPSPSGSLIEGYNAQGSLVRYTGSGGLNSPSTVVAT